MIWAISKAQNLVRPFMYAVEINEVTGISPLWYKINGNSYFETDL